MLSASLRIGQRLRKDQLILVDVAERDDAREDGGLAAENVEENPLRRAHRALCRQIECDIREPVWLQPRFESLDKAAVDQRGDDRAQQKAPKEER